MVDALAAGRFRAHTVLELPPEDRARHVRIVAGPLAGLEGELIAQHDNRLVIDLRGSIAGLILECPPSQVEIT
jgi:hypothetical protein